MFWRSWIPVQKVSVARRDQGVFRPAGVNGPLAGGPGIGPFDVKPKGGVPGRIHAPDIHPPGVPTRPADRHSQLVRVALIERGQIAPSGAGEIGRGDREGPASADRDRNDGMEGRGQEDDRKSQTERRPPSSRESVLSGVHGSYALDRLQSNPKPGPCESPGGGDWGGRFPTPAPSRRR